LPAVLVAMGVVGRGRVRRERRGVGSRYVGRHGSVCRGGAGGWWASPHARRGVAGAVLVASPGGAGGPGCLSQVGGPLG